VIISSINRLHAEFSAGCTNPKKMKKKVRVHGPRKTPPLVRRWNNWVGRGHKKGRKKRDTAFWEFGSVSGCHGEGCLGGAKRKARRRVTPMSSAQNRVEKRAGKVRIKGILSRWPLP